MKHSVGTLVKEGVDRKLNYLVFIGRYSLTLIIVTVGIFYNIYRITQRVSSEAKRYNAVHMLTLN